MIKQPKVYVKKYDKIFDVIEIHFDINVVYFDDGIRDEYMSMDFEDVEFIYNTGYKDMKGNDIYTGDLLEYQNSDEHYLRRYVVEKDEDTEYYYYLTIKERYFVGRLHGMNYDYSVIGNIYENKDLLRESDRRKSIV